MAMALLEDPQSGDSTTKVGSGNEAKAGDLVKSLASRPFWEERRVPRQPSMRGGRPISDYQVIDTITDPVFIQEIVELVVVQNKRRPVD